MAKITPIDIIKGVSGKFGGNSREYFATNKTSYNIYFAKRVNDYQGPATEKQLEIRDRFKRKQKAVADWLRANRPASGRPATEAYRVALALKYRYKFSSINQVIHKYLNDDLQVCSPTLATTMATRLILHLRSLAISLRAVVRAVTRATTTPRAVVRK